MLQTADVLYMLNLQNTMNNTVMSNWRTCGHRWNRAAWIECAELMEHIGWKWWKKQTPNLDQAHLELVDIWHFGLSAMIEVTETVSDQDFKGLAEKIEGVLLPYAQIQQYPAEIESRHQLTYVERLTVELLGAYGFPLTAFLECARALNLTHERLFGLYIGKNVLNVFRQDNGYKEGTYIKTWYDGREDNDHLMDAVTEALEQCAGESPEVFQKWIRDSLVMEYRRNTEPQA